MIKHFNRNTLGRDFVVGDVHGCTASLHILLHRIGFDETTDRCFSVGDLIDRGPDSVGALALLNEHWFHAVRGNHEDILLNVTEQGGKWDSWVSNGGAWARGHAQRNLAEYAAAIRLLPLAITVGEWPNRFNVIHAEFFGSDEELDAGNFDDNTMRTMMWGRSLIRSKGSELQRGLSPTFCGHTITSQIQRHSQQIYIDTGAYVAQFWDGITTKNALTIIEPATGESWRSTDTFIMPSP